MCDEMIFQFITYCIACIGVLLSQSLQVLAFEFVLLANNFVLLAIEFVPLAFEFIPLARKFVHNKVGSWSEHENKM